MNPFSNWANLQTITIQHRGVTGTDVYGNDEYGTVSTEDARVILVPLLLKRPPRATRPGGFGEDLEGEFTVATGYTMFAPAGTVIAVTDTVLIGAETWIVDGDPGTLTSPFTGIAMLQVELDRVTG